MLRHIARGGLYFAVLATVAVACASCAQPAAETPEEPYARQVYGNVFSTRPLRGKLQPLRLRMEAEGSFFEWLCSECHTEFGGAGRHKESEASPDLAEHRSIKDVFDHGDGVTCLNCHHAANRIFYADRDGSEMPAENPDRLCAKCHGPIRRDWDLGLHGRQNGYWDRTRGERTRLSCIQCHDPHFPKFPTMRPDPAPARPRLASRDEEAQP